MNTTSTTTQLPLPQPLTPPPGGVDPRTLASVNLSERATLAPITAVYFCIGEDDKILYIDATRNLNQKWIANKQYTHLATIAGVRIAWMEVDELDELEAIKQAMIEYWEPMLNDWRYKLQQIQDLTIDGWHNFQKVNLEIWAIYRDAVMPTPVSSEIAIAYRQVIKDAADEFKKVKSQERRQRLEQLRIEVRELERTGFVPPAGCYLSTYKVKKPYGTYEYWKQGEQISRVSCQDESRTGCILAQSG